MIFPDRTHLLIATIYPATALCNVSLQCKTSGFMQLASGFMQLAATGCRRNILHCHCLFEGKCYLCINYYLGKYIVGYALRGHDSGSVNMSRKN